jgi:hypothetical protein
MKTSHIRFYIPHLERQGADLETKIEELQDINQVLREKDKMKDVIASYQKDWMRYNDRLNNHFQNFIPISHNPLLLTLQAIVEGYGLLGIMSIYGVVWYYHSVVQDI